MSKKDEALEKLLSLSYSQFTIDEVYKYIKDVGIKKITSKNLDKILIKFRCDGVDIIEHLYYIALNREASRADTFRSWLQVLLNILVAIAIGIMTFRYNDIINIIK